MGKSISVQALGPEFESLAPHKKLDLKCVCNANVPTEIWGVETEFLGTRRPAYSVREQRNTVLKQDGKVRTNSWGCP